jgi:NADPH-dependent glutamate synthase beta subunit-like oxidoreductase
MAPSQPRVAIVGAGPAGAFAAACLLRSRGDVEIDLFERLPTPWGLLRGGVAPDHQEIKRLEDTFDSETLRRGCRLFGNVEVGVDVSHSELMRHYTAVIYATGAQTDKSLGIPGEDLPGSWAATEFVAWYNGHPDYRGLEFDLSAERAVVIGNGNVAADVTRMLTLSARELERTDVADHALEALRESRIEPSPAPSCASWGASTTLTPGSTRTRSSSTRCRAAGSPRRAPSPRARTWSCSRSSRPGRRNPAPRGGSCCASCAPRWRSAGTAGSRLSTSAATSSCAPRTAR